ncbi:hypothetical protein SMZ34_003039, partial [Cronobacter sakazakii]|nr:hypothetical protein [Cronobacter sakazakii]
DLYKRYDVADYILYSRSIDSFFGVETHNRAIEQSSLYLNSHGKRGERGLVMTTDTEGTFLIENKSYSIFKNKEKLLDCLKGDEYIEGETSKTVMLLETYYLREKELFGHVFQEAWLQLYAQQQSYDLRKFINMASSIKYSWLNDRADALILSACSHKDIYVNEAAIRAVESWEQPKHAAFLQNIKPFEVKWLEDYKKSVLAELE